MADICDLATERTAGVFICDNTIKTLDYVSTDADGNLTYSLELQDLTACTFVINGNNILSVNLTNVPNDSTPINSILLNIVELLNEQANLTVITQLAQDAAASALLSSDKATIATDKEALISPHYSAIDTIELNKNAVIAIGNELINTDIIETIAADLDLLTDSEIRKANANKANIDIISGIETEVISLASIKDKLDSLYADKVTLDSLYTDKVVLASIFADKVKLDSIYADKTKLDSLYTDKATLDSLFNDKATLDSLVNDKIQLDSLYSDKSKLDSLYADKNKLDTIYTNLDIITSVNNNIVDVQNAESNANTAKLKAWASEASRLTADSYATEAEDVYVKIYTSNGDGTYTATNIAEYSSYHWNQKATATSGGQLAIDNNLSDLSDPIAARTNLGLNVILDSVTQSIANLATAQASIQDDGEAITIDTVQHAVPIKADIPSTDDTIITIDDATDSVTIGTNASINFFSSMVFTSATPNTRNVSIKVVNTADDTVLECFDMALTIPNGTTDTISRTFLLTVGKNGTPDAPLTIRFEIVADDTGYTLDSFHAVIATSSSYDVSTEAQGITYNSGLSSSSTTNVQDALDESFDRLDTKLATSTSNVLMNESSLSIDGTAITKNHAVVTYTGTDGDLTKDTGITSKWFTDTDNGSDYYIDGMDVKLVIDNSIVPEGNCVLNTSRYQIKKRSGGTIDDDNSANFVFDGLRPKTDVIKTDQTDARATVAGINTIGTGVILVGNDANTNENASDYVLYQTLYTHIKWGLTSHNKRYIEAYNPVTREGMIIYEGSGSSGHEIPHSAGVEFDYWKIKNLSTALTWLNGYENDTFMKYTADSVFNSTGIYDNTDSYLGLGQPWGEINSSTDSYVVYYKSKSETFTIGTYIGTGAAGNKVTTTDVYGNEVKLRDVVIKRIDAVGHWVTHNTNANALGEELYLNLSDSGSINNNISFYKGSIAIETTWDNLNGLNGQYLYMGYIDTNATITPDDSYFSLPTDNSNLNVVAGNFTSTDGLDAQGYKRNLQQVTESIDFTGCSDGLKWVGRYKDGTYRFEDNMPSLGSYEKQFAEDNRLVFNTEAGKFFETINGELITNGTFDDGTTDGWIATSGDETISIVDGKLRITRGTDGTGGMYEIIQTVIGATYRVSAVISLVDDVNGYVRAYEMLNSGTLGNMNQTDLYFDFIAVSDTTYIQTLNDSESKTVDFDNISVYKVQPTLGSALQQALSFIPYPIAVASETPMDIRKDDKLFTNSMDSLEVSGSIVAKDIKVKNITIINGFDLGQKWINTSSRILGVTYTNDTDRPIEVFISVISSDANGFVRADVNNETIGYCGNSEDAPDSRGNLTFTVPAGALYGTSTNGTNALTMWTELR